MGFQSTSVFYQDHKEVVTKINSQEHCEVLAIKSGSRPCTLESELVLYFFNRETVDLLIRDLTIIQDNFVTKTYQAYQDNPSVPTPDLAISSITHPTITETEETEEDIAEKEEFLTESNLETKPVPPFPPYHPVIREEEDS